MPDSALLSILSSAGVAGVFCVLFIIGAIFPRSVVTDKNAEIAELKQAVEAERERANTAVAAASATRDILAAIQIGRDLKAGPAPGAHGEGWHRCSSRGHRDSSAWTPSMRPEWRKSRRRPVSRAPSSSSTTLTASASRTTLPQPSPTISYGDTGTGLRGDRIMLQRMTWRTWTPIAVILGAYLGLGFGLSNDGKLESLLYRYGLLGASVIPALFAVTYTILGFRGAAKWWTNTLGTGLVLASLTLVPITWPLAWVFWFDGGSLRQSWLAWVEVSGPVLSALAWLALCFIFLRTHRDGNGRSEDDGPAGAGT